MDGPLLKVMLVGKCANCHVGLPVFMVFPEPYVQQLLVKL